MKAVYVGAQQYVEFVANGRYRDAWARLLEGDPAGYVRELKRKGYFTADEDTYRRGVERIYQEFLTKLTRDTEPAPPLSPEDFEETKPDLDLA